MTIHVQRTGEFMGCSRRVTAIGWGLLSLLGSGSASAQAAKDTTTLPPIVVTATAVPTRADHLSQRVTVLDGDGLRAAGFVTVADALASVPGLAVVRTGAPGAATSVFVRGGESDYVKVLVDGVPVNAPGGAYDFANLTLDDVERIEVVRGPASVLYGSDAVSGVVQVFTRAGGRRLAASARGGTYGTLELGAELTGGGAAGRYGLAARWSGADGLYPLNNRYDNRVVAGRVELSPDAATSVALSLRLTDADFHFPTDGSGNVVDGNQRQLSNVTTLGLALSRALGRRLRGELNLTSNQIGGGIDDAPDGPGDTLGGYAFRSQQDVARRGADARLHVAVDPRAALVVGAGYEHERERSSSAALSEFGPFETELDATRHNWAGYAEVTGDVARVAFTGGARLDRNQRFGTFLTYRAGASVTLPAGARLFGSVGSAYKEPTFFEQFGGTFVTGNPALDPERTRGWETGLEAVVGGGRVRASVTYFQQRFRDLIQFTATPATPDGPNYVNVAAASADGVESELEVAPLRGLTIRAHHTYLRTEVTDAGALPADDAAFRLGDRLLRRPTHTIGLMASERLGRARATTGLRWVGERDDADFSGFPATRVTLPSHTLVDVGGEFDLPRVSPRVPGLTLTARVENLFDATYQEIFGFPARGRMVLIGGRVAM